MQIRLLIYLAAVLVGFLYISFINAEPIAFTLGPKLVFETPVSLPMLGSFIAGVLSVMIVYFYDAIVHAFQWIKDRTFARRAARVRRMYEKGMEKIVLENIPEAEKLFGKALSHNPNHVPSLIALGRIYRDTGRHKEAIETHSRAAGLDEKNIAGLLELADDYTADGQYNNALTIMLKVKELARRSLPPLTRMRDICLKAGNFGEAQELQKQIVAGSTGDRAAKEKEVLVSIMYEKAMNDILASRPDSAVETLRAVIRNDDKTVPAHLKLAEVLYTQGQIKESYRALEKGFHATHSIAIARAISQLAAAVGDMDRAVAEVARAKFAAPDQDAIGLFLAEAHIRVGRYDSARREMDALNGRLSDKTIYHLLEAKIQRGENNVELAMKSLDNAYAQESAVVFKLRCPACGHLAVEHSGKCPSCGAWNILTPVLA